MFAYTLHIDAYSPETIPMARLAEYMHNLAELLGHKDAVHFEGLETGSTRLKARVEKEASPKVSRDMQELSVGNGSPVQLKARYRLDEMMADDGASGRLLAEDDDKGSVVIEFPGATATQPETYGPITQSGHLQGILVRIGGADATAHLLLQSGAVNYSNIVCDRSTARELGKHRFEPIRVNGDGRWIRERNGEWALRSFRVKSFDVLQRGTIRDAINDMQRIAGDSWHSFDDEESVADVVYLRRDE